LDHDYGSDFNPQSAIHNPQSFMRISAKAEYACFAMLELAANYRERQPVRVKAIADAHGIPQRFLVQILLQLKGAGLVMSVRGAAGGYQLARSPETISLADVIHVIDSALPSRSGAIARDDSPGVQAIRAVWDEVQTRENRLLEKTTLTELVRRAQQSNSLSYQI
jgi:Rrf2 family cysteine metabolism transcriptional repressor